MALGGKMQILQSIWTTDRLGCEVIILRLLNSEPLAYKCTFAIAHFHFMNTTFDAFKQSPKNF